MATTKYIVNNLDQNINANISLIGLSVSNINGIGKYKALLTQTGGISSSNISTNFNGKLIKGETYTIDSYNSGDDFINIADWQSPGTINATGSVFIATGNYPKNWLNGSTLVSSGNLIVDVLENTLGYDIQWVSDGPGPGTYLGFNGSTGPIINSFPQSKTTVMVGDSMIPDISFLNTRIISGVAGYWETDQFVFVGVLDTDIGPVDNRLWFLPVEITIKQDLDITPVIISGTISTTFPFGYAAFDLYINGGNYYDYFASNDGTLVNNATELANLLNNNSNTNIFGTFSAVGGDVLTLTIPQNLKNQLSPDGDLTFDVYSD